MATALELLDIMIKKHKNMRIETKPQNTWYDLLLPGDSALSFHQIEKLAKIPHEDLPLYLALDPLKISEYLGTSLHTDTPLLVVSQPGKHWHTSLVTPILQALLELP